MSTFLRFARRATSGLVATQMLLGAVSVSALALSGPVRAAEAAPIFGSLTPPSQPAPAPAPAPQAPAAPQSPAPEAPAAAAPVAPTPIVVPPAAPQAPAPQAPAPQTPAPQAPQAPAPQGISYLPQHGAWQGFYTTVDGVQYAGVMTHLVDGGAIAIAGTKDDQFTLIMADPNWHLRDGMIVPVRLIAGGRFYTLTATAHGNRLDVQGFAKGAVQDLLRSSQAQLDMGNGALVWTVTLEGLYDAARDAARIQA